MKRGVGKGYLTVARGVMKAPSRPGYRQFVEPTSACAGAVDSAKTCVLFNFRPDRAREITARLWTRLLKDFRAKKGSSRCIFCMTQYDASMPIVQVAF
jgi:2,3-bisphosphoglycerate-independent phosphoglycerate mutase